MRRIYVVLVVAILAIISSFALVSAQEPVTATMNALNNSGQTGTVTLTPKGNQTEVTVNIRPGAAGVAEPAHIHVGACPDVAAVKYPLTSVMDGKSTTTVDAKLSDLQAGNMAVNVHKSAQEIQVYVSCGNIPVASAVPATLPKAGDNTWPIVAGVLIIALALLGIGFGLRRRTGEVS